MKVIGYTRVSTAEQAKDGYSLAVQRAAIESYCAIRGWDLAEIIEDDGYTGRTDDRPGLQRALILLAKRNGPKAIVVARLDRLARSTQHFCEYIVLCKKQKWSMVAIDFNLDTTTPSGRLLVRVLASVAEWESEVNSVRVSEGMREKYQQLRQAGIAPAFGFRRQVPDHVVRRICRARARGLSYRAIADQLAKAGIEPPGKGKRWYPSTVQRIYQAEQKQTPAA